KQFDSILHEFSSIINSFFDLNYLDTVILIEELLDNKSIDLSYVDQFRLLCLQTHALLKYRLDTQAMNSIQRAKDLLKKIDPSEFSQGNTRNNFLHNNPHSSNIFYDRGYLSGDNIYLLFLEIILGMNLNIGKQLLRELIHQGESLTAANHPYAIEFQFLSKIVENQFFTFNEISDLKNQLNLDKPFFKIISDLLVQKDLIIGDKEFIDPTLVEDLRGMDKEVKSTNSISQRFYMLNIEENDHKYVYDSEIIQLINTDLLGRTKDDEIYRNLVETYFNKILNVDKQEITRIQYLANIAIDNLNNDEYKISLTILLYLKDQKIFHDLSTKIVFQEARLKFIQHINTHLPSKLKPDERIIVDLGSVYYFISRVFFDMGNYKKAHTYLDLSLIENFQVKQRDFGISLSGKGIIYNIQMHFKLAIKYFLQSHSYLSEYGSVIDIFGVHINLTNIYLKLGQIKKASFHTQKLIELANRISNPIYSSLALEKRASIELNDGNYLKTIDLLIESISFWRKVKNIGVASINLANCILKLYFIYEKIEEGNSSSALINEYKTIYEENNLKSNMILDICYLYELQKQNKFNSSFNLEVFLFDLSKPEIIGEIKYFGLLSILIYIHKFSITLNSGEIDQIFNILNFIKDNDLKNEISKYLKLVLDNNYTENNISELKNLVFKKIILLFDISPT
ncbi:MAG: hypothetical protein OEY49_10360, partial [Candidatus Heimdallarchaeota archaeon]|nr:hypothetical protein [Candidatus Heimdallarchaeota archaeon]